MSLADELLADLEDGDEDIDDIDPEIEDDITDINDLPFENDTNARTIHGVAKLWKSNELQYIMSQVEQYYTRTDKKQVAGPVELEPEYQLIIEANNINVEIDNEINVIHKFVRDIYHKRFPELESLVPTAIEYIKTVMELGNNIDKTKNSAVLQQILTSATIMVVSVTASTTQGEDLSEDDQKLFKEACEMAVNLLEAKRKIFQYVESRMSFICPNLSKIIGASTAAKLLGSAGGLTALSKMPSCNILLLGAQKKTLAGFSSQAILPHTGYVYYCEIAQKTPPDLRRKAAKLLAAKCSLAARVDSFHEAQDGAHGEIFRQDIEGKLEKLQEPPPVKQVKALPAPIDAPRKKRGGRRYRKMKERLGMTDMRRMANRMNFGEIEEDAYQDDLGFSLGNIGKGGKSGRLRGPPVDSKTKARISKTLQQKLTKQSNNIWGGSTTVKKNISGTASSVAFTPLQGLEIVNPQAAEKRGEESTAGYFSTTAGFIKMSKSQIPNLANLVPRSQMIPKNKLNR